MEDGWNPVQMTGAFSVVHRHECARKHLHVIRVRRIHGSVVHTTGHPRFVHFLSFCPSRHIMTTTLPQLAENNLDGLSFSLFCTAVLCPTTLVKARTSHSQSTASVFADKQKWPSWPPLPLYYRSFEKTPHKSRAPLSGESVKCPRGWPQCQTYFNGDIVGEWGRAGGILWSASYKKQLKPGLEVVFWVLLG